MSATLKRNLLLAVALVAVLAGVIIAISAGTGHSHKTASTARTPTGASELQLAAGYLGVSREEFRRRLRGGATQAEVAASTPGKSSAGLLATLLADREAALRAEQNGAAPSGPAIARARGQIVAAINRGRGRSGALATAAAARYLGLSEAALRERLDSGRSLAQLAAVEGRTRAGLITAIVAVKTARLHSALSAHAITPREERTAIASLPARVSRQVDQHLAAPAG